MDSFEWDENKWRENLEAHGVDFGDAALIFQHPVIEAEDERNDYGETRIRALGHVDDEYFRFSIIQVDSCGWGWPNRSRTRRRKRWKLVMP